MRVRFLLGVRGHRPMGRSRRGMPRIPVRIRLAPMTCAWISGEITGATTRRARVRVPPRIRRGALHCNHVDVDVDVIVVVVVAKYFDLDGDVDLDPTVDV